LREKFPKLSDAKLKEGIFIGPRIREIISDDLFENLLTETEKSAWLAFKAVCLHFLGNIKAADYKELVRGLLQGTPDCGVPYVTEHSFCTFPIGLPPSETGRTERQTWCKVPPGYFHQGEKTYREIIIEHVS
jgi:hypothetical protein